MKKPIVKVLCAYSKDKECPLLPPINCTGCVTLQLLMQKKDNIINFYKTSFEREKELTEDLMKIINKTT